MPNPVPTPSPQASLRALQAMLRARHPLAALDVFHAETGDAFKINLPGFQPVFMVGPEAARFVLVEGRDELRWRNAADPVVDLLRHGVLVEDGESHDELRKLMNPSLHRRMLAGYVEAMWGATDEIISKWADGAVVDMLVEMRKITLLILTRTLFAVDFAPELERLFQPVIDNIRYISPGLWMLWRGVPRLGYRRSLAALDEYLYRIIAERRRALTGSDVEPADMLGVLICAGLDDDLIRDQLLTMLIAGHDTSTALLAWSFYLLGTHPEACQRVQAEARALEPGTIPDITKINNLEYTGWTIKEALRLYPPIHLGSRLAAADLHFQDYVIPAGTRVVYSIYLTQRHPDFWDAPGTFRPERHGTSERQVPYSWLAFGGGPRNCIGGAFGQVEAKLVLAQVFQRFDLELVEKHVRPHMGATLEPHPGVRMKVRERRS
ncbi:MAG: cytochrome P450 [Anaerolineales bacterium]|nr:cytochrome P450 [Anaerolineales bacterium]